MAETLTLAYRHDGNELSTGVFFLADAGAKSTVILEDFTRLPYIDMMKRFAKYLIAHPSADAAIARTDRPGLAVMALPADEVALFRADPAAAIRARVFPPQVVHVGVDKSPPPPASRPSVIPPLDAGYTVLADLFGDVVYARAKTRAGGEVECVGCGHWCPTAKIDDTRHSYRCVECATWLPIHDYKPEVGWAGFKVAELLSSGLTQFFLPRRWNDSNWITKTDLGTKYNNYTKEKST